MINRQTRSVIGRHRNAHCWLVAGLTVVASAGTGRAQYIPLDLGDGAAYDINSSGTIAGFSTRSGNQRAFRYENGILTELGALGSDPYDALDRQHAFLLSVPEPSAWALFGIGGIGFVVARGMRFGK